MPKKKPTPTNKLKHRKQHALTIVDRMIVSVRECLEPIAP
jgi:hypothetical protein